MTDQWRDLSDDELLVRLEQSFGSTGAMSPKELVANRDDAEVAEHIDWLFGLMS